MRRIAVVLVAAEMLAGCAAGRDFSMDAVSRLTPGMTQDEVKVVMGDPQGITAYGNRTIWTWVRVSGFGGSKSAAVTFVNGKLADQPFTQSTSMTN